MAAKVNLYEAKTQLSQLVDRAAAGEEIIIAKNGEPLARLVPLAKKLKKRQLGHLAGKIILGPELDEPIDPEMFEGDDPLLR
jgi:prevent-host-death family protein